MSYQELVNAVKQYYGAGSDVWTQLVTGQEPMTTAQFSAAMKQVPGVTEVVNGNGDVILYEYSQPFTVTSAADDVASAVNSNVPAVASGTQVSVTTPTNVVSNSSGVVTAANSGTMTAGQFISRSVLPAVAAAGAGISLGKFIDGTLYNANPDFWDARGMSSLNPATWGDITSGDTSIGANLFNMIFGIDADGKMQAYLPEDAFAYIAAYMANRGAFNPSGSYTDIGFDSTDYPNIDTTNIKNPFQTYDVNSVSVHSYRSNVYDNAITYQIHSYTDPVSMFVSHNSASDSSYQIYAASKSAFEIDRITTSLISGEATTQTLSGLSPGSPYSGYYRVVDTGYSSDYDVSGSNRYNQISLPATSAVEKSSQYGLWAIALTVLAGNHTETAHGNITGITDQPNATIPDFSGIADLSDIAAILALLQNTLPNLWQNGVEINTPQDDGTNKNKKYIPIGLPSIDPNNPTKTEGKNGSQSDSKYDPENDPDNEESEQFMPIFDLKPEYDPEGNPEYKHPKPTPNPTDTGEGTTPSITPPVGSTSALFSIYNPSQAQVDAFGAWLWSDNFVNQLKKIFNDPMESIISLHKVFASPSTGGSQNIYVGYLDSGVSSATVTSQYTSVDCGTVSLGEYFGNVFDYPPYTQVDLFLPFIGIVRLDVADVMRSSINVTYRVDVLTGACLAQVNVTRDMSGGVLYQFSGNCAVHYPVSSGSYVGLVGGILSATVGAVGTIATGGALAPAALGAAGAVMSAHTDVSKSGGFTGNSGAMGGKTPYLIISRPQTALAGTYLEMEGIGSNSSVTLSSVSGYCKVKEVQLSGLNATESELTEIESILKGGVIV